MRKPEDPALLAWFMTSGGLVLVVALLGHSYLAGAIVLLGVVVVLLWVGLVHRRRLRAYSEWQDGQVASA